jgi:hypothetical protein
MAATFLLMAEKWIKLADEKARGDADMLEQLGDFNRRQLFGASPQGEPGPKWGFLSPIRAAQAPPLIWSEQNPNPV